MITVKKYFIALFCMLSFSFGTMAQIMNIDNVKLDTDSIKRDFSNQPYFGLYKDNYFIFGPSLAGRPTTANTNVKFQISFSQRLTRSTLPWGTYLYLFYTQKCFWNILQNSLPMTDLNFNPGIGITKPFFVKDRYIGKATLLLEHESNGRDGEESRSWNRLAVSGNILVCENLMVHSKIWLPIVDGQNNRDIVRYCGFCQFGFQLQSNNGRFTGGVTVVPRTYFNCNTIVDFGYRIFKKDNQYLFLQIYNGYGEGLLEYNRYHFQARVGICIRPKLFSDF